MVRFCYTHLQVHFSENFIKIGEEMSEKLGLEVFPEIGDNRGHRRRNPATAGEDNEYSVNFDGIFLMEVNGVS